ncbi:hypothetical protein B0O99DRAFT_637077 [Bisporella sp. PMI_857]|nr:hypothetical protein B0O99DRAFT_637077 [Bisporella sp. PMI_857]
MEFRDVLIRAMIRFPGQWVCVPAEEPEERHLYLAASTRYLPSDGGRGAGFAVQLGEEVEPVRGTNGRFRSGAYSVG